MSTIRLDWESPDAERWQRYLRACGRSTAFQSWSWGAASEALGETRVRRAYIEKNGRPVGLIQVFEETRLGLFTLGQIIRGPLFHQSVMPEDRITVLKQVSADYPMGRLKRLSILPELPDGPAARELLAAAGFIRVKSGYETAWLDLRQSATDMRSTFRQNFRNQLCRAETLDLRIDEVEDPRPLLTRYDHHRRSVGYDGPSGAMLAALPSTDGLCLQAWLGEELLAGVFFVLHGVAATYQVGWTSAEGRRCCAHNLLLWHGIQVLAARGIHHLDLGGLDRAKTPGIAHFKAGLGGDTFSLPGVFV